MVMSRVCILHLSSLSFCSCVYFQYDSQVSMVVTNILLKGGFTEGYNRMSRLNVSPPVSNSLTGHWILC
jgi:hypothetical protein